MKIIFYLLSIAMITFSFLKCNPASQNEDINEILSAQENDVEIAKSKTKYSADFARVQEDIIEKLYKEELLKNEELLHFDDSMNSLKENMYEYFISTEKYETINENYFKTAYSLINSMHDSILRNEIKVILKNEENSYLDKLDSFKKSKLKLEKEVKNLNDRENLIRFIISLESMKQYQNNKMPSSSEVDTLTNEFRVLLNNSNKFIKLK